MVRLFAKLRASPPCRDTAASPCPVPPLPASPTPKGLIAKQQRNLLPAVNWPTGAPSPQVPQMCFTSLRSRVLLALMGVAGPLVGGGHLTRMNNDDSWSSCHSLCLELTKQVFACNRGRSSLMPSTQPRGLVLPRTVLCPCIKAQNQYPSCPFLIKCSCYLANLISTTMPGEQVLFLCNLQRQY